MKKIILHSGLNCFYASVEMLYHPEYRNIPLAVSGDAESRHGIILAKNQAAAQCGIKTGEVIWQAINKCPRLKVVRANLKEYVRYSTKVKDIYYRYSNQVESFGIDEAWIDVTGSLTLYKSAENIAKLIKETIKNELGLTVSIGIANNKVYSKLASDMAKQDDFITMYDYEKITKVFPLPVNKLLYVGRATTPKLLLLNIRTIGDLAAYDKISLHKFFGKNGLLLHNLANGNDHQEVLVYKKGSTIKSISNGTTTPRDLRTTTDILIIFTILAESICARLKEVHMFANVITITAKNNQLTSRSCQCQFSESTDISKIIIDYAMTLFHHNFNFKIPIRSLSIKLSGISYDKFASQLNIFSESEYSLKDLAIDNAMIDIRKRFGHTKIKRAVTLVDKTLSHFNPKDDHVVFPESFLR